MSKGALFLPLDVARLGDYNRSKLHFWAIYFWWLHGIAEILHRFLNPFTDLSRSIRSILSLDPFFENAWGIRTVRLLETSHLPSLFWCNQAITFRKNGRVCTSQWGPRLQSIFQWRLIYEDLIQKPFWSCGMSRSRRGWVHCKKGDALKNGRHFSTQSKS